MAVVFKKAVKEQARARVGLIGPSGSGKTYTALLLAKYMGNKTALIDTEHASAAKYADEFDFDVVCLDSYHPKNYIEAIKAAGDASYDVLIIDSLSHAWAGTDGALELADRSAAKYGGNRFAAWRDVTPLHNQLIESIISSPCHVIATMRSKMEYVQTVDDKGKTVIRKVGMAPVQRDGMEYEFDIVGDLDLDHNLVISKTRCRALDGAIIAKPGKELAETIMAWLTDGAPPTPKPEKPVEVHNEAKTGQNVNFGRFWASVKNLGMSEDFVHEEAAAYFNVPGLKSLTEIPGLDTAKLNKFLQHLVSLKQS